jgi:S1-C subfamily serine protease
MDERMGVETVSVVTQVLPNSPAMEKGVRVGCILVGINYEKFISHAHSVATLKYVKRPVTVRFRRDTK